MRNRVVKAFCKVPMNLQLFAEGGDGAGADGGNGGGSGEDEGAGGEGGAGSDTPPSFDDFLKTGGNQAEFDRRVQKAVNTAVTKAQEKWQALADDKLSEAEKLAKMTKEEKAQYMQQKREKELTDREAAITRKELMAEAKNTLASDGLPQELAEVLDYSDADTCKKSMEKVKEVFQRAVETAVEEKLKGGKPPKKAPGGDAQKALEEQVYNIMMGNN
ncbi:DUF4355 domain-containing protein [Ruminococcus sp. RTP21358st1_A5_RTP21358_211008]|uniref:DUF4355 domain-containing protein n=1 Tax=unclassified Ruminococcus TaxID=2608920 RepID=UPI0034A42E04